MKVLIVDDEATTRRVLKLLVERAGYEAVVAVDGQEGLDLALSADPPHIILLDWVLPVFEGPEICARVRAASPKIRPYILILSAKQTKAEITAGLDAGADDFVSKPFNADEMQARLRVARRTVTYQLELQRRIAEIESLKQRNRLLGEIISSNKDAAPAAPGGEPTVCPLPPPECDFSLSDITEGSRRGLADLSLDGIDVNAVPPESAPSRPASFSGWSALLVGRTSRWIDVVLEAAEDDARAVFTTAVRRPPATDTEVSEFFSESSRALTESLANVLRGRLLDTTMPLLPRSTRPVRRTTVPPWQAGHPRFDLKIGTATLHLTIVGQACAPLQLVPGALRENDVLQEQFPPPESDEVPILMTGAVLTPRVIDKLASYFESHERARGVKVHRPSRTAHYFHTTV